MEYRQIGNTGLKVSVIGYGNWLNSDDAQWQQKTTEIVKKCFNLGINFFDTAEIYGEGSGEIQLGIALKELNAPRTDYVLSTKLYWENRQPEYSRNSRGLSRKHIIEGLKNSLKRLQHSYVDIVFAHRFDPETPLEETCRAFDWCIRKGLTTYWGTSEWPAELIEIAIAICKQFNLHPPVIEQPQYNIFARDKIEKDYYYLFQDKQYATTVFSPLASGILTGKYNDNLNVPGRFDTFKENPVLKGIFNRFFSPEKQQETQGKLKQLGEIAKSLGITQTQLALGWVIKNKDVTVGLTGFTSIAQVEDTVETVKVYKKITKEIDEKINEIFKTEPAPVFSIKLMAPMPKRRDL